MEKIIIYKENASIRIDKFLVKEFFSLGLTRGEIIRNIKEGNILVNKEKVKPSHKLIKDDYITAKIEKQENKIVPNPKIEMDVIYEDENIIIIDKPAGVSVHPGSSEQTDTLANGLVARFPEIEKIHDNAVDAFLRPGIVHRLDRETSGVMVVARNMKAFEELKNSFKFRKITKKYITWVYGKLAQKEGVIDKNIARAATYKKQVIAGRKTKTLIRPAITEYRVLKEIGDSSLLEVVPKTGRMHQIRVHLFSIGHPVVGDKLYKLKKSPPFIADRHMLHAQNLKFNLFGKNYSFKSPIPADMLDFSKNIDISTKLIRG
jgi:23S rRNA pseudouridine1911/1915/1917 synthase